MLARHEDRPRARLLTTLVTVLVIAATTACSGVATGGGGAKAAAQPVITPKQAATVVMKLQTRRAAAFGAENVAALKSLDADPQLSIDTGDIRSAQAKSLSVSDAPYLAVTALVPKQTSYPAWFMAIAHDSSGSSLDLFARHSPKTSWLLLVESGLPSGSVGWKKAPGGWAVAASLPADPSKALAAYWNQNTNGADQSGAPVAPGNWTSGVAAQVNSAIAGNEAHRWAQIAVFTASGPLTQGLKLTDGSVLAFAWVNEVLKTRDAYGNCFVQPDSSGFRWDPLVPNGNYVELDISYTWLEGMSVPADGPLVANGYEEATTGVSGPACGA